MCPNVWFSKIGSHLVQMHVFYVGQEMMAVNKIFQPTGFSTYVLILHWKSLIFNVRKMLTDHEFLSFACL